MPSRHTLVLRRSGRAPAAVATALAAALLLVSGLLSVLVATASPAASATRTVKIGAALSVADLTIQPGTTVTWEATDGGEHRVRSTSGPVKFDSGNFTGSWTFTFDTLGSYAYVDHRHEAVTGSVTVSTTAPGGGGGGGGGGGTPAAPKTASVSMANKAFSPVSVSVAIGGTVTWKNNDSMPHNVTSTSGAFRSPTLNPGQTFTFTFTKAGSYGYFCTFHGGMNGTVVVPTAGGGTPAPTPPAGGGGSTTPAPGNGSQTGGGGGGGGAGSKTVQVTLKDSLFSPASVTANVGDTIVWHNAGAMPHTVTAADKSFDQQLMPGATFTYVLRKQGTVNYICTYHPAMKGTLTVGAAPAGVKLPPPGAGGSVSGNGAAKGAAKPAPAPPAAKSDGTKVIEIKALEMTFEPKMADARVGDTISWVNTGTIPHTVTAKDKSFDRTLQPGERFNYVLRKAGTIDYVCTFHPGMDGMLMVKEALPNVKLPAAAGADEAAGPVAPAVHRHGSRTTYEVQAKDDAFSPALLDVRAGDTVVWVNVGATKHRVRAEDGSFDTTLAPGKKLTVTFEQTGTVRYDDPAHPGMFGAVVVRTAPVAATSQGLLGGLPFGPAGAVGVLVLLGLLAGAGAVRHRGSAADDADDDVDGDEPQDASDRLLDEDSSPELEPVP
jgi:plastocyanin